MFNKYLTGTAQAQSRGESPARAEIRIGPARWANYGETIIVSGGLPRYPLRNQEGDDAMREE